VSVARCVGAGSGSVVLRRHVLLMLRLAHGGPLDIFHQLPPLVTIVDHC